MVLVRFVTASVLAVCAVAGDVVAQRAGPSPTCRPPLEGARAARLRPGTYRLVLVPTRRPPRVGPAAAGRLWLWPASPDDRSPATGERAAPVLGRNSDADGPREAARFVGATDVPLARAGVVLDRGRPRVFPPPTSRDPVYPGVLVDGGGQPELWIGTENGRAAGRGSTAEDGPGAVLRAEQGDAAGGFAGTWGPAGRVGRGGYFCARYAGPPPARGEAGTGRTR